ncbi:MAG TPA: hypothetical protein VH170_05845 [Chthoniobacterales bacterium]|jgi:hypothetical protein|nr:hypothetical protein [Chthoniobacterales bacterium]
MPLNTRSLRDANLQVTKALPTAGASNQSSSIDLATINAGRVPGVELLIDLPATPNLADTKKVTLTLKDSADNNTFAAVTDVPGQVTTGAGGAGGAAINYQFKLPIGLRRYIQLDQAVDAAGGDSTAKSGTLSVVF